MDIYGNYAFSVSWPFVKTLKLFQFTKNGSLGKPPQTQVLDQTATRGLTSSHPKQSMWGPCSGSLELPSDHHSEF